VCLSNICSIASYLTLCPRILGLFLHLIRNPFAAYTATLDLFVLAETRLRRCSVRGLRWGILNFQFGASDAAAYEQIIAWCLKFGHGHAVHAWCAGLGGSSMGIDCYGHAVGMRHRFMVPPW